MEKDGRLYRIFALALGRLNCPPAAHVLDKSTDPEEPANSNSILSETQRNHKTLKTSDSLRIHGYRNVV